VARAGQAARGLAQLGVERRQSRQMEAKQTDPRGQKRKREEAEPLPHTAMAETAGAHQNRAAMLSATRSHQRAREIRVKV
jgi:hypothetical protein